MKINYLKEFVTLAQNLNYTQTADQLFMTQSILSRHIQNIEEELGIRLLNRSTHGVELTADGLFVREHFKKILAQYDTMTAGLASRANGSSGSLKVGMIYYAIDDYYESLIRPFENRYPNVVVSIISHQPPSLMEDLIHQKIDVGLTLKTAIPPFDNVHVFDAGKEPMIVLTSDRNPLSSKDEISVRELGGESFVFMKSEVWHEPYVMKLLSLHDMGNVRRIYTEQIDTLTNTVLEKNAVAMVARHVSSMHRKGIAALPVREKDFEITVALAWLRDNANPCLWIFLDHLTAAAEVKY
jgi:DNA-binding transcriptional LysR family regulator